MIDFIWKNEKASEHGIIVQSLPPITKAPERTQKIEIEGRDGDIVLSNGFSAYDKKVNIGLAKNYDVNWLINWLQGKGQVIFSNEDTVFYNAEIINQIDFKKLLSFKTATITFHVQPYKYLVKENKINFKGLSDIISGKYIYLNDSSENVIDTFKIKGKSEQKTRSGKNLLNFNGFETQIINGLTITNNNDGSITINGTTTDVVSIRISGVMSNLKAGTYAFKRNATGTVSENFTNLLYGNNGTPYNILSITGNSSFITSPTVDYEEYYLWLYVESGITFTNYIMKPQLESGSISTEWELYGASPSPDYPSEIKTIKGIRNIFNKDITPINYYYDSTGAYVSINTNTFIHQKIIPTSREYTISYKKRHSKLNGTDIVSYVRFVQFKSDGTFITRTLNGVNGEIITLDKETAYFILCVDSGTSAYFEELMIEEGSVVHSHVPYGTWAKVKITAKNIIKFDDISETTSNGITCSVEDDVITLNGQSTINGANNLLISDTVDLNAMEDENYTLSFHVVGGSKNVSLGVSFRNASNVQLDFMQIVGTNLSLTKKISAEIINDTKYFRFYIRTQEQIDNLKIKVKLEKGSIATDDEIYKENELLINLNKQNLFETPYTEDNKLVYTSTKTDDYVITDDYVELEANKMYTFSCKTTGTFGGGDKQTQCFLLLDKGSTSYHMVNKDGYTFIPTISGKYYLRYDVNVNGETHSFWDFKVYEGVGSADYYELCSIENIEDTLKVENGEVLLTQKIGKFVLNGSESWKINTSSSSTNGYYEFLTVAVNKPIKQVALMCDTFKIGTSYNNYTEQIRNRADDSIYINILGTRLSSLNITGFITWLSENLVTVYYELEKPSQIKLKVIGDLKTYKNVSYISNNVNAEMELQYYRNCELDIDNQGYVVSKPIIEIEGDEEISVYVNNNQSCILNLDNEKIILDSEEQEAYYDTTLKNNKMNGEFPLLSSGNNKVSLEGKVKNVIIHPKSRWL